MPPKSETRPLTQRWAVAEFECGLVQKRPHFPVPGHLGLLIDLAETWDVPKSLGCPQIVPGAKGIRIHAFKNRYADRKGMT